MRAKTLDEVHELWIDETLDDQATIAAIMRSPDFCIDAARALLRIWQNEMNELDLMQ